MGTLAAVFVPLSLPFSALLPLLPFEVDRSPSSCTRGEMGEDGRLKRITQANIKQWEPPRLARRIDGESQTFSSEIEKEGGGGWNGGGTKINTASLRLRLRHAASHHPPKRRGWG